MLVDFPSFSLCIPWWVPSSRRTWTYVKKVKWIHLRRKYHSPFPLPAATITSCLSIWRTCIIRSIKEFWTRIIPCSWSMSVWYLQSDDENIQVNMQSELGRFFWIAYIVSIPSYYRLVYSFKLDLLLYGDCKGCVSIFARNSKERAFHKSSRWRFWHLRAGK